MSRSCLCRVVPWLGSIGLMALWAGPTQAQDVGSYGPSLSSARMSSSSFSGAGSYFGGSSTYVPFGGAMGGFVPYSSGPVEGHVNRIIKMMSSSRGRFSPRLSRNRT